MAGDNNIYKRVQNLNNQIADDNDEITKIIYDRDVLEKELEKIVREYKEKIANKNRELERKKSIVSSKERKEIDHLRKLYENKNRRRKILKYGSSLDSELVDLLSIIEGYVDKEIASVPEESLKAFYQIDVEMHNRKPSVFGSLQRGISNTINQLDERVHGLIEGSNEDSN